jgi:DNA-binding NtrC family response regulator
MSKTDHTELTDANRILLVDDEDAILDATSCYFTARGFKVDCAREREEAEALLSTTYYSLVIADMRMTGAHGREGLELLSYVRERCLGTKVIVMTAYGSRELEREALRRGANAFLEKPIRLADMASLVQSLIGGPA